MAEPAAVVSAVAGTIALLLEARDSLGALIRQFDRLHRQNDLILHLNVRIKAARQRLRSWETKWTADGFVDEPLLDQLWGREGHENIQQLLLLIRNLADGVNQRLRPATVAREHELNDISEYSEAPLNHIIHYLLRLARIPRRFTNTWYRIPTCESQLNLLDEIIELLERLSIETLESQHHCCRALDAEARFDSVREFLTIGTALSSRMKCEAMNEALYHECVGGTYTTELSLTNLVQKVQNLGSYSGGNLLGPGTVVVYDISIRALYNAPSEPRSRFGLAPLHNHSSCELCHASDTSFVHTHDHDPERHHFQLQSISTRSPTQQAVTLFVEQMSPAEASGRTRSLRRLLDREPNDFHALCGFFARLERIKLAFFVTNFTFIMLLTPWTRHVCSCTIRYKDCEFEREYFIMIGRGVRHCMSVSGERQRRPRPWCQEGFKGMPIRRLGLLLAEIAIAATIVGAHYNNETGIVEIDPGHVPSSAANPSIVNITSIDTLRMRIERAAGQSYADAVDWCLTQRQEPPEGVGYDYSDQLLDFHQYVLEPIHKNYQTHFGDRLRSQRVQRRRERALRAAG